MSHERSHPILDTAGRLGMGGLVLAGGFLAVEGISELVHHPLIDIHFGDPGATTPKATGEVRKDTVEVFKGNLNACAGHVTEDVGGTSSSREFWVSGFAVNQLYPITWKICGAAGVELDGHQTLNPEGKVLKINVTETDYNEDSVRVDTWDALSCLTLDDKATLSEIKKNEEAFNKDLSDRKVIPCTTSKTEHPTGMDAVTPGVAYENMDGAADFALVAGALTPQSDKTQEKIDKVVVKDATTFLQGEFPDAKVSVKAPPLESPVDEFEQNWKTAEKNMKRSLYVHKLVSDGNNTGLQMELAENGVKGADVIPVRFKAKQITKLNKFMNAKPSKPTTPNALLNKINSLMKATH